MTDTSDELAGIEAAARDLVPDLTERLERHGLGEIEVRRGDLRVRLARGDAGVSDPPAASAPGVDVTGSAAPAGAVVPDGGDVMQRATVPPAAHAVSAPAVGYFVYGDGLGPGLTVAKGDALGYVDVLGVRHEVRAPRSGTVRNLVTETGEAVEYGQVLIELEAPTP